MPKKHTVKEKELRRLRKLCERVAGPQWILTGETYDPTHSVLQGHCAPVSVLVRRIYGGEIVGQTLAVGLTGYVETHFWNRLPNGKEIDLTSDQFGGDGLYPRPEYRGQGHTRILIRPEWQAVYERFCAEIEKEGRA